MSTDTLALQLEQTLARGHQVLQILQMGYLILQDPDPDTKKDTFVITRYNLQLLRTTVHRLPFLQQWQPHPAATDTLTTLSLII